MVHTAMENQQNGQTDLWTATIATAMGNLMIVTDTQQVYAIAFVDEPDPCPPALSKRFGPVTLHPHPNPLGVCDRLHAYLAGQWNAFDDLALNPGGTPFQQKVWHALRAIPPGTTRTYAQLATQIGQPTACRAVGLANSQNPIAIAIPCHRVIGSGGALTGYAGGLERKHWLLQHEGIALAAAQPSAQLTLF